MLKSVLSAQDQKDRITAARWSVGVGIIILACKLTAWWWTESVAIMSDAIESVVHVAATLVMYRALRWSLLPPDADHPYGHGKASAFSVGFEGGLVAGSGALVLVAVVDRIISGGVPHNLEVGMLWTLGAAAVNTWLGLYLLRTAKRTRSDVLRADAHHVLADVWTSGAALVGVGLLWLTGQVWIDWLVGALAGVHLLIVGSRLIREAIADLMDVSDPETVEQALVAINEIREPEWHDVHRLRVHRVGERRYIDFHLVVPAEWTVQRAHDVVEKLEHHILKQLEAQGAVNIHLDCPHNGMVYQLRDKPFSLAEAIRFRASDPPLESDPSHKHDFKQPADA